MLPENLQGEYLRYLFDECPFTRLLDGSRLCEIVDELDSSMWMQTPEEEVKAWLATMFFLGIVGIEPPQAIAAVETRCVVKGSDLIPTAEAAEEAERRVIEDFKARTKALEEREIHRMFRAPILPDPDRTKRGNKL